MKNFKIKKIIILTTTVLLTGLAIASPSIAQDQTVAVYKTFESCGVLENDTYRLHCFDTVLSGGTYSQEKIEKAKVAAFGDAQKIETPALKNNLIVEIIRIAKSNIGTLYFYLKNGQVWKQTDERRILTKSLPYQAEIKKKSFGGFQLSPVGSKRSIEVERVK